MRLLSIDHVKEDMQIARNIHAAGGNILLAEGMRLTTWYIERLKDFGISSVYIMDHQVGKIEVDELVTIQTRVEATKLIKETMDNVKEGANWDGDKIGKTVNKLMDELIANRNIIYNLVDVRAMNDYTFGHSISVCLLSLMVGIFADFGYRKLKELGVGALLHDIGKVFVSDKILNKNGKLTPEEYREVQQHTILGYELLRKNDLISMVSAHVAWQHHENFDGSGYPRGLKGHEIHEFARIVTLADVFDALSTDRIYRKRFLPHEAIEYIRDKGKAYFDPDFNRVLLQRIAPFPIGATVLLNTGEKAIVIKVSKELPSRPLVKVIIDKDGKIAPEPVDVDLKKDLTKYIIEGLKDD
jgi:HD-GYP domain-containing protein (c-di-GMP phosphodiesterase class II)